MNAKKARVFWSILVLSLFVAMTWSAAGNCAPAWPFDEDAPMGVQAHQGGIRVGKVIAPPADLQAMLADLNAAVLSGGSYLRGMQADITEDNAGNGTDGVDESPDDPDDGGWDWVVAAPQFSHSTSASPTNIFGVSVLGIYYAYKLNPDPGYMTAMQDAADYMVAAGTSSIRSGADLKFLMMFNYIPGVSGTAYNDAARAKYDQRIVDHGSAQGFAEYIRDARNGQGYPCGIIAWDIGVWAVVAQMLDGRYPGNGYDADADAIAEVIYQDSFNSTPGYFDVIADQGWDPTYSNTNYYWYTLGITGLMDAFIAANVHTGELPGLKSILDACRYPSGAYSFSYGANTNDEDWQSTAYSVVSISGYSPSAYINDIVVSAGWLASTQDVSGGFVYGSGNHYPEVGSESTVAMYFGIVNPGQEIPTLTEWGMIIMFLVMAAGIVWFVVRQRRNWVTA